MDRDPRTDTSLLDSLTAWLFRLLLVSLLLAAGFFGYFILPKMEASWNARGMRPPAWATGLVSTNHFVIKYWYAILVGLALLAWLRNSSSGPSRD
jgi:type II secretory pathway component PulF